MSSSHNFCRLCLQNLIGPFRILNKELKANNMLKHLFPGMNINLVEKSKICNDCFKYIQFSYTMRETVIKNEQKINSSMELVKTIEENTCRLCLNTGISQGTVFLYENNKQTMSFLEARSIIEIAIVDMCFERFKKPIACNSCWKIIRLIFLFKKRCFATEKILKFYCTKNNLTSLTNKDIESVSICYNSNLQKFSKGEKYDQITNFTPNIDSTFQATSSSIHSIIKPVDVYLNNFTNDDEDDVFEEEVDDIFIESPKIVKDEPLDTSINVVKEKGEQRSTILDEMTESEINKVAREIKIEEARDLNNTLKDIPNKGDMIRNSQDKKVSDRKFGSVSKESHIDKSVTISTEGRKEVADQKETSTDDIETTVYSRIGHSKVHGIKNNVSKKTEIISKESNKKMDNCLSENIELGNFEIGSTENQNIKESEQQNLVLEHAKKGRRKLENSAAEIKFKKLDENKDNGCENQEETTECDAKEGKEPQKKSRRITEAISFNNNSEDKHKETLEHVAKRSRNKHENVEPINILKDVEKNCREMKTIVQKIRKHDGSIRWGCKQCEFKTKYKYHLNRHSLIHNKNAETFTCSKCVYSTYIKRNLERHVLTHASENFIRCALCIYSTVSKCNLKKHMLIHQKRDITKDTEPKERCNSDAETEEIKKPLGLRCMECPFVTNKEAQIIAHLRAHKSQEKIFKCTKCHYISTRTHSLKDHMEVHNEDSSKKNYKCKLCSFTGKRHTHLISHMLTHQNEFKFSCSQCSYKAKRKNHLVTHMLRHQTGDKKIVFQCPYCKYKSIRKEHLKGHCRNVHSDKAEINCFEAQVTVKNKSDGFTKEKKTATCPCCPYRTYSSVLNIHIFTVHFPSISKEMQCNDCPYRTDIRKLFLKHINTHRNKDEDK